MNETPNVRSGADAPNAGVTNTGTRNVPPTPTPTPMPLARGFRAYAVVGQLGFVVATPLLLFMWGGNWVVTAFGLDPSVKNTFALIGVVVMVLSLVGFFGRLIKIYGSADRDKRYYSRREVDSDSDDD
ncbi:hypothetical protein FACS1894133_1270 [Clostridia bacterium]|nr:hypothetical protein FACS1894133_1270 [Clostridia bacterium]